MIRVTLAFSSKFIVFNIAKRQLLALLVKLTRLGRWNNFY